MNPNILFKAAKAAYDNRETAKALLAKIKDWRRSENSKSGESMSLEDRLARLESNAEAKDLLDEEQSELIAGLAANTAQLSASTEALLARIKVLIGLVVLSLCLSAAALVIALVIAVG